MMVIILLLTFIISILIIIFDPYIDIYEDYRNNVHYVLWYNSFKGKRKCKQLNGD